VPSEVLIGFNFVHLCGSLWLDFWFPLFCSCAGALAACSAWGQAAAASALCPAGQRACSTGPRRGSARGGRPGARLPAAPGDALDERCLGGGARLQPDSQRLRRRHPRHQLATALRADEPTQQRPGRAAGKASSRQRHQQAAARRAAHEDKAHSPSIRPTADTSREVHRTGGNCKQQQWRR